VIAREGERAGFRGGIASKLLPNLKRESYEILLMRREKNNELPAQEYMLIQIGGFKLTEFTIQVHDRRPEVAQFFP
jgi:hypothetical protein